MNWDWWKDFASVFNDIALGIGALLAGSGALKVFSDWWKDSKNKRYRKKWEKKFSKSRFEKGDFALYKLSTSDKIYGVDKQDQERWWIHPLSTLHELGYDGSDATEVSESELKKYEDGEQVDFRERK